MKPNNKKYPYIIPAILLLITIIATAILYQTKQASIPNKRTDLETGQWLLIQYGIADGTQLSFYTLQNSEGNLILIDGGTVELKDYVNQVLKELGNHVDAWILTHPHHDHIGAFNEIYPNNKSLTIDKIYAVDMAAPELCLENAPWDSTKVYEDFLAFDIPRITYVHAGDTFNIQGLNIEVFNAYDDYVDEISNDLLNDGSMMFKVNAKNESMLFCADIGQKMNDYLLEKYRDALKADYVQMGHHGNGGLEEEFYESIGAKAAFFDAPDWLLYDTSGKYDASKKKAFMKALGCDIYSFSTAPNEIILK